MDTKFNREEWLDLVVSEDFDTLFRNLRNLNKFHKNLVKHENSIYLYQMELKNIEKEKKQGNLSESNKREFTRITENLLDVIKEIDKSLRLEEFEEVKKKNNLQSFIHFLKEYKFEEPIATTIESIGNSVNELNINLENQKNLFEKQIEELKGKIYEYEELLNSEKDKAIKLQKKLNDFQTQKATDEEQIKKRDTAIKKLEQEISKYNNESETKTQLQKELESLKSEKEGYEQIKERIKEGDNKISLLEQEIQKHNQTINEYNLKLEDADKRICDLQERNEALQKLTKQENFVLELENLKKDIGTKIELLKEKNGIIEKKERVITNLEEKLRLRGLGKGRNSIKIILLILLMAISILAIMFVANSSKLTREREALSKKLEATKHENATNMQKIQKAKVANDSLNTIITSLLNKGDAAAITLIDQLQQDITRYQKEINRLSALMSKANPDLSKEISGLKNELSREREALKKQLDKNKELEVVITLLQQERTFSVAIIPCNKEEAQLFQKNLLQSEIIKPISSRFVEEGLVRLGISIEEYCNSKDKASINMKLKKVLNADIVFSI